MNHKRKLPVSSDPKIPWTYWTTRNSVSGELAGTCSLWIVKPQRVKHRYRVTWVAPEAQNPGFLGDFAPETVVLWFGTYPETDLELIRVDQTPTAKMLEEARKQSGST